MPPHCTDNEENRQIGAFWECEFCKMAKHYGHVFTPHQWGRGRIAAFAYSASGRIILPDITIWSGAGQHHEVKHKNPTPYRMFGLESYRFDSLVTFADTTAEPVYYTIHNWEVIGRDSKENRPVDWQFCEIKTLRDTPYKEAWGRSWVNGAEKRVPILYWPVTYFVPLTQLWQEKAK